MARSWRRRARELYRDYGVPDTANGRLEMIMLHIVLFLGRLEGEPAPARALGQAVFDRFCDDMDASMREMGVGDLAVPRKMRRIGEAFYGRQRTYGEALAAADGAELAAALGRLLFADGSDPACAARLAHYVHAAAEVLVRQGEFDRGELVFPDPKEVLGRSECL